MNWSSTKPTCVGWYWYREHGHATIVMVVIDPMYINHPLRAVFQEPLPAGDCLPVAELDGEWAGPIEQLMLTGTDVLTLRKQLFNAAAAVSGYFDAEEMLNKRLPYSEQLTHLARLISRELDVSEAIR